MVVANLPSAMPPQIQGMAVASGMQSGVAPKLLTSLNDLSLITIGTLTQGTALSSQNIYEILSGKYGIKDPKVLSRLVNEINRGLLGRSVKSGEDGRIYIPEPLFAELVQRAKNPPKMPGSATSTLQIAKKTDISPRSTHLTIPKGEGVKPQSHVVPYDNLAQSRRLDEQFRDRTAPTKGLGGAPEEESKTFALDHKQASYLLTQVSDPHEGEPYLTKELIYG